MEIVLNPIMAHLLLRMDQGKPVRQATGDQLLLDSIVQPDGYNQAQLPLV